jgi:hypothetical protein
VSELHFSGEVNAQGKLLFDDRPAFVQAVAVLAGHRVVVTLERAATRRSSQANRFWWGVVIPAFGDIWSPARVARGLPPYTPDDVHEVLVQVLLGFEDGPVAGTRVRKRTSIRNTAEFAQLVDDARALAVQQYRVHIPAPNEPWEEAA